MNTTATAIGILVITVTTFQANESRAERIRHCRFSMIDRVLLIDSRHEDQSAVVNSFCTTLTA